MKLRNFSLGIHSYPGTTPGSNHTTAQDIVNLRVDKDGYLRPTPGVITERYTHTNTTGIAAGYNHLFFALDNGDFYKIENTDIGVTKIGSTTSLRGKLSIIDDFETFFLITSEAQDDKGYFYDVETELLQELTYAQTTRPATAFADDGAEDSNDPNHPGHTIGQFFYVFCEVKENDNVPDGSPAQAFHAPPSDAYFRGYVSTDENSNLRWGVYFNGFTYNNSDTTHIYVYRSPKVSGYRPQGAQVSNQQPPLTDADAFTYFDESQYFLIGKLERGVDTDFRDNNSGDAVYFDPTDDSLERWNERNESQSLGGAYVLTGLPEGTKSWKHFNGYTFCATGGDLRFSDIDYGVLKHSTFPEVNSINAPGDVEFCENYNETLIFGDSKHLHELRGYDPYNYQVSQIATVGPVSAYSSAILPSGAFGFISEYGFYAYDGGTVQEIGSPQLDHFFENKAIGDGFITPLPNGDSIWSVEFLDGTQLTFLLNTERLDAPVWTRLTLLIHQAASFRLHSTQEWTFGNDDYWTFGTDDDHWTFEDEEETYPQVLFVNNNRAISEYLYHDLESYGTNPWIWTSNRLRGGSETTKVFDRLKLAGYSDNNINVTFDLDIQGETVQKNVTALSFPKTTRKKRVPIKRRAQSCEFTVQGFGNVVLREVELDSRVVGRV